MLDVDRLKSADALFHELLDVPESERDAALAARCAGDEQLRTIVRCLLEADSSSMAGFLTRPLAPPPRETPPAPPEAIGGYLIVREIGRGAMGVVYEARQQSPARAVALKVLHTPFPTRESLRRFRHEAEILGFLQHPGIAQVYEAGVADLASAAGVQQTPFLVMEQVRGNPLSAHAQKRGLGVPQRLELFARICDAVQHAHQKGVIHRDLKPGNILVDETGQPKVLDFGVARVAGPDAETVSLQTAAGQLIGTLPYMSPEQVAGDPRRIDTRSDVYALGVILYELLAGRPPLDLSGQPIAAAARIILERAPAPLGSIHRACRGDIETLVGKALEKDPARRYGSAQELAADVRRCLGREPISARPPSAAYLLRKFAQRNRGLVSGVAVAFIALVLGVIGTSVGLARAGLRGAELELARKEQEQQRKLADEQRALAEQRAEETGRVAAFQAEMLSGVDVEAMGRGLKQRFREQVGAALQREWVGEFPDRRPRTAEEVAAELAAYEQRAFGAHGVDVARQVMEEFVLRPAAAALEERFTDQPLVQAQLHRAIGETYHTLGLYAAAEPHLRAALALRERALDRGRPDVSASMNSLARLLTARGDYGEAESLHREALSLRRELLGKEHLDVAVSVNNLAYVLKRKGDYAAAEPRFREALALARQLGGAAHPLALRVLNNLADLLRRRGAYDEAEALHREALALRRKHLGDEHGDVASSLNNLALLLREQGRHAEAGPLYREALAIRQKRLGAEHPDVAVEMDNLAILLGTQGDLAAAEPLVRAALEIRRRALGDQHVQVAGSLNSLASLLKAKGAYSAAEPLFREALALRRRLLGAEHPAVATSLNNLAQLLQATGDYAAAEPLCREALEMRIKLHGGEHPWIANSMNNLAALLHDMGDRAAAEPLYREALAMYRRTLGEDHAHVANAMSNLAKLLADRGDDGSAAPLYDEALALWRRLGADRQPPFARCLSNLGELLHAAGDYAAAEARYGEALNLARSLLGDEHPDVADTLHNLGALMCEMPAPDFAAAEAHFRAALAIRESKLPPTHPKTVATAVALARTLATRGEFAAAEALLLATCERSRETGVARDLAELYDAWHAAEPDGGYELKAAEWRAALDGRRLQPEWSNDQR